MTDNKKINFYLTNRAEVVDNVYRILDSIEIKYEDEYNNNPFGDKYFFANASVHIFDYLNVTTDELKRLTPLVDSIELLVDQNKKSDFFSTILEWNTNTPSLLEKGVSRNKLKTTWRLNDSSPTIRIDFIFVEFTKDNKPTELSALNYSWHIYDVKMNILPIFHKLLLRAIPYKEAFPLIVKTRSGVYQKKERGLYSHSYKGLRVKLRPVYSDSENKPLIVDDLPVFEEIPSNDSIYETDNATIFYRFFDQTPIGVDLFNMQSFVGLLSLINKYCTNEECKKIEKSFLNYIFGDDAELVVKGDKEGDILAKCVAYEQFKDDFMCESRR